MIAERSGTIIRVSDMAEFGERLNSLRDAMPKLMVESIEDALTNGQSEILAKIWQRTPRSDRARYAYRYKAIDRGDWKADGSGLKSGWRKKIGMANGIRSLDRLDEYGMDRLRKSLFGGQSHYGIKGLTVKSNRSFASFTISSDLPYAKRMHEATNILDYWSPSERSIGSKRGKGWSTQKTGAKFLSDPVRENKGTIRTDVRMALAWRLQERMK